MGRQNGEGEKTHEGEIEAVSVDEVDDAAGRAHRHIHPGPQLPDLATDVHSCRENHSA